MLNMLKKIGDWYTKLGTPMLEPELEGYPSDEYQRVVAEVKSRPPFEVVTHKLMAMVSIRDDSLDRMNMKFDGGILTLRHPGPDPWIKSGVSVDLSILQSDEE